MAKPLLSEDDYAHFLDSFRALAHALRHRQIGEALRLWHVLETALNIAVDIESWRHQTEIRSAAAMLREPMDDAQHTPAILISTRLALAADRLADAWEAAREALTGTRAPAQASGGELDGADALCAALARFPAAIRPLRDGRPRKSKGLQPRAAYPLDDEYDVQDALFLYLKMAYASADREDHTPNNAGSSSRIDFSVPELHAFVEAKFVRPDENISELKNDLLRDIADAQGRVDIELLVLFIVEAPGAVGSAEPLERLAGTKDGLAVRVVRVSL